MKLILGLGNPGWKFRGTRHNIGFRAIDELHKKMNSPDGKWQQILELQSLCVIGEINGSPVVLAKPLTYMNNSGIATRSLLEHFGLSPDSLIVIHDDKDIKLGNVKIQRNRGHGGHNGIRSIIDHLGTKDFQRVRIGVTGHGIVKIDDTVQFVLGRFRWSERRQVKAAVALAVERTTALATTYS